MGVQRYGSALAVSLLKAGWPIRLRVSGWSMKPLLRPGCILRIVPIGEPPRVGDIIFYRAEGGKLVSHRVMACDPDSVWTKGDACLHWDGVLGRSRVLGKVVAVETPCWVRLDGFMARQVGRFLGHVYPVLVNLKTAIVERLGGILPRRAHV